MKKAQQQRTSPQQMTTLQTLPTNTNKTTKTPPSTDNFISGDENNATQLNLTKTTTTTLKKSDALSTTLTKKAGKLKKKRRNSTLDDMKTFLASFNKDTDKTRVLLSEMKTPKNQHPMLSTLTSSTKKLASSSSTSTSSSATNNATTRRVTLQNDRASYLKARANAESTGPLPSSPMKRSMRTSQSVAEFLASDQHFENNNGSMAPDTASWIESLRRMREGNKKNSMGKKKNMYAGGMSGGCGTPTAISELCPMEAQQKERTRLARRLSTLSFPMKACMAAIEESDGDIEKSVALLLRWYPKGSGSRVAVQNLVKMIVGAEKKLQSLRAKLQILYAPSGTTDGSGDMTNAVRAIFNRYDVDGSGECNENVVLFCF